MQQDQPAIDWNQRPQITLNPHNPPNQQPVIPAKQYFRLFSRQMVEFLAIGAGIAAFGVAIQGQRKLKEQSKTIDVLTTELSKLKIDLTQQQQTHKEAISFLYDKMKDAHKVAFKTESGIEQTQKLPIPKGFTEKDCSFFTMKFLEYYDPAQSHQYSEFKTDSNFQLTEIRNDPSLSYSHKDGARLYATRGMYGVLAAKPIMGEEEIERKKRQYKLLT